MPAPVPPRSAPGRSHASTVSAVSALQKAVVLLSGGLDSAVALACARRDGFECHALSIDYGQRHSIELAAAARVAGLLGAASHRVVGVDLRAIGGSALTSDLPVPPARPLARPDEPRSIPITYVPARNLIFLSLAAGLAEVVGARDLFIGANAVDFSGYPDCRPEFLDAFSRAVNLATRAGVESGEPYFRVRAPLLLLSKAEIIRLGASMGVDFALTHSCYDPDAAGRACGVCESCKIRRRGFAEAGAADPARGAT